MESVNRAHHVLVQLLLTVGMDDLQLIVAVNVDAAVAGAFGRQLKLNVNVCVAEVPC